MFMNIYLSFYWYR